MTDTDRTSDGPPGDHEVGVPGDGSDWPVSPLWLAVGGVVVLLLLLTISGAFSAMFGPRFDAAAVQSQARIDCRQGFDVACDEDIRRLKENGDDDGARDAESQRTVARFLKQPHP